MEKILGTAMTATMVSNTFGTPGLQLGDEFTINGTETFYGSVDVDWFTDTIMAASNFGGNQRAPYAASYVASKLMEKLEMGLFFHQQRGWLLNLPQLHFRRARYDIAHGQLAPDRGQRW